MFFLAAAMLQALAQCGLFVCSHSRVSNAFARTHFMAKSASFEVRREINPLALLLWKEEFNSDFKNYFYAKKKRFENVFPVFYRRAPTEIQNSNFSTILKLRES